MFEGCVYCFCFHSNHSCPAGFGKPSAEEKALGLPNKLGGIGAVPDSRFHWRSWDQLAPSTGMLALPMPRRQAPCDIC